MSGREKPLTKEVLAADGHEVLEYPHHPGLVFAMDPAKGAWVVYENQDGALCRKGERKLHPVYGGTV